MALLQAFLSLVPYVSNARAHSPWPSRSPTPDFWSAFSKGRQVGVGGDTECSSIVRSSIFAAHTEDQCIRPTQKLIQWWAYDNLTRRSLISRSMTQQYRLTVVLNIYS